jgi:hypothetical protein
MTELGGSLHPLRDCGTGGQGKREREIPEHLVNLFEKLKGELTEQEQGHLRELLCEFEDVFAKNEFDLGKFDAIKHGIDTGSSRPVKQRMRRTPLGFAGEEEAQLRKMLGTGVIQPSVSEWASAPVLIRKRCGSVQWCVDYRALNALTTNDVFPLPSVDRPLRDECLSSELKQPVFSNECAFGAVLGFDFHLPIC